MSQDGNSREYVSKGVSALPEWWDRVELAAGDLGINRSLLIRIAVDQYLKAASADAKQTLTLTSTTP